MRFGVNVEGPILWTSDTAYTDVMWTGTWNGNSQFTMGSNNYPTAGTGQLLFCVNGDKPGLQTYNFYAQGVFTFSFGGSFGNGQWGNGLVYSSLVILPPNYPGNTTSTNYAVPANYAGNPTNNDVTLGPWYPGNPLPGQSITVPANWPANNFSIGFIMPAGCAANTLNTVVQTCQAQFNVPQSASDGSDFGYSWINMSNVNTTADPNEYPNHFHLIRPGYPAWQTGNYFYPIDQNSFPIFTTAYLDSFAPFCCLRFMDWMNTNGNTGLSWGASGLVNNGPYSWADRATLNDNFGASCCYENMIALCNATGCDMWMNVPLQATDDWKVGFANLVVNDPVYHLNPWLHVYYEHGNELWNWGFIAWQIVEVWAQSDFASYEPTKGAWYCHGMETGKLIMSDIDDMQPIFNSVSPTFGRPILAGQMANPVSYCGGGLFYIQTFYGPPKNYLYGMAGAPYFGSDPTEFTGSDLSTMQANMQLANQNGIYMCAYEGGQGLGFSTADTAFQTTPAMATQYLDFAAMWQQNGGDLCNFFTNAGTWGQYGYWGMLPEGNYINELSDPTCTKYNTAASLNNMYGCNCGNAAPPPPPPPPSNGSSSTATPPAPAPASPSSSSSSTTSATPATPGHWAHNSTFGRYWVWDIAKDAPMTPTH
jgi:hypothetical protein